jgi:hypothetical protein
MSTFDQSKFCPKYPAQSADLPSNTSEIAQSLGGDTPCYKDKSVYTSTSKSGGGGSYGLISAGGGSSTTVTDAKDISIGCEQMALIVQQYQNAVNAVSCVVSTNSTKINTSASGVQSIVFRCSGDIVIDAEISQDMELELVSDITLSDTQVAEISSTIKESVKNSLDILQKTSTTTTGGGSNGFLASPQGQKLVTDTKTKTDATQYDSSIKEKITELNTTLTGLQSLLFEGQDCTILKNIKQKMSVKLQATSIVDVVYKDTIKKVIETVYQNDTRVVQDAEARAEAKSKIDWKKYLLIGGVVLLVLCCFSVGMWVLTRNKSQSTSPMSPPYAYPPQYPTPYYPPPQMSYPPMGYSPQTPMGLSPAVSK